MTKSESPSPESTGPRVGVPWRTEKQERARDLRYNRFYLDAVRKAGGVPVQISLLLPPAKLARLAGTFDAFVLPGSPADVNPKLYGAASHAKAAKPDTRRERTDFALLKHALAAGKPVLAICYGIQSFNVHLGGTLYQDIPSELRTSLVHSTGNDRKDAIHEVRITAGRLAALAGRSLVKVNSVHRQAVRRPGKQLRVAAKASDGVIEALEWTGGPGWALGVQWHPERMPKDPLAQKLFRRLVSEAVIARDRRQAKPARRSSNSPKPVRRAPGHATRRTKKPSKGRAAQVRANEK